MKKPLLFLFFIAPLLVSAQFTDNFSDGNFTSNPAWSGDNAKWQVAGGQLQSNSNTASDVFYLSTPSSLASDAQWELFIKLDFSTSSNNYVDVYLVSDSANLKGPLNGYFVRIGTTQDEISLYRKDGLTLTKIIDGVDGRSQTTSSNNMIKLKVKRSIANNWLLEDDVTGTGNNYFQEGTVNDGVHNTSAFFGFVITQSTASFFNRHYFDDIYAGPIILDTISPVVSSANVLSDSLVDIKFSEGVDQLTTETVANYSVANGIGNPILATRDATDISLVHLVFASPFISGVANTMTMNAIADLSGNAVAANTIVHFVFYQPVPAAPMDVVINEILFNARTGGVEFVEIYNASQKVIDLKNMKISKESLPDHSVSTSAVITTSTHIFLPGEYLVLSDDFSKIKSQYNTENPNAFLNMNLPDLLTDEDIVLVADANSNTIDQLHYFSSWHFPLLNSVDGVSLERLNFYRATQDSSNWHSAAETAGFATPGYKNSEYDHSNGNGDEIFVDPEIFSPDNDGYHDVVNIHYHFSNPGNTATVVVYDSRGRLIRNLANNELLGNDGAFVWDGVTNEKEKARIGMYVFYIQVFDLNGDTKKFKKTCVLGGRL